LKVIAELVKIVLRERKVHEARQAREEMYRQRAKTIHEMAEAMNRIGPQKQYAYDPARKNYFVRNSATGHLHGATPGDIRRDYERAEASGLIDVGNWVNGAETVRLSPELRDEVQRFYDESLSVSPKPTRETQTQ
jgi:hypothetical protein